MVELFNVIDNITYFNGVKLFIKMSRGTL